MLKVDPIVDSATFEQALLRRESRSPAKVPPRVVSSPTLLTGLLKCGQCGAGMTTATGKGGLYKYYKCNTKISKGAHLCETRAMPMDKLDDVVMNAVLDKILVPDRLKIILSELKKRQKDASADQEEQEKPLRRELDQVQAGTTRLYEAVERGLMPLDESLQERMKKLKERREAIEIALSAMKRKQTMPLDMLSPKRMDQFASAMRKVLTERSDAVGKAYLRLLVSEIRIKENQAEIVGSNAALAHAMLEKTKVDTVVPTFVPNWLPDLDSNQGPAD